MADVQQKAHLLAIAAELRNCIYRLALVEDEVVQLSRPENQVQPALVRVCHQIRQEALSIYYTENTFSSKIHGFDGLKAAAAFRSYQQYKAPGTRDFYLEMCEDCREIKTDKLHMWLEAYYHDIKDKGK